MIRRPLRPSALLAPLALLLAVLAAPLRAQLPGEPRCGWCNTTGKVPVDVSSRFAIEQEHGDGWEVLFCADAIESDNMGLDWEPCPRCKTPSVQAAAQAEWDAIAERNRAWLAERRKLEEHAGVDEMAHVETTHFIVSWGIPKISTADKKSYREHEAAHLYAARFERFYARFQDLLGIDDADNMVNKHHVYVFEKSAQADKVGPIYTGLSGPGTQRRSGGVEQDSVIVTWNNRSEYPTDEDLHRHLVHNLVHQLTAVYYNPVWFGQGRGLTPPWLNDRYGWLDAGLAHWFEDDLDGQCTTFCFQEQDSAARWKGRDWRKNIWKAVLDGDWPSFTETIAIPTTALSAMQHQFCWSWVDFLMSRGTQKVGLAIKLAKYEKPVREILPEAFGLSMLSFEQEWAAWVEEAYAPKR